jgi:hypothetical protein
MLENTRPPADAPKAYFSNSEMLLRVGLFLAHAISAIAMLAKASGAFDGGDGMECAPSVSFSSTQVRKTDQIVAETRPVLYPIHVNRVFNATPCNSTWCMGTHYPEQFDIIFNLYSQTFGASWNTIATITVFEWITASYALFYVDPFDSWLSLDSLWWGLHPVPFVATAWNGGLLVGIWAARESLNIPPNNAFIFSFCLIFTMIVQNFMSISREPYSTDESQQPILDTQKTTPPEQTKQMTQWRTDHFLRNRKKFDYRETWKPMDANFHEPRYNQTIENDGFGAIPRYLEYAVSSPLLLVALFSSSMTFAPVWKYQAMFMALFTCNLIGIGLHYAVVKIPSGDRFVKISWYLFIASWMIFVGGIYLFVWTTRDFLLKNPDDTGMPLWVLILIWLLILMYSMFGFIASRYYIPRMLFSGPFDPNDWAALGSYFDYCSLLIKLPVAWTIWVKGAVIMCSTPVVC